MTEQADIERIYGIKRDKLADGLIVVCCILGGAAIILAGLLGYTLGRISA